MKFRCIEEQMVMTGEVMSFAVELQPLFYR
jgi:hypothetical protein